MVGRSKVWRLAKFADGGRSEVECNLCPTRIKYVGNTTNIARHLELKHPLEFAALDPAQAAATATALARHEQQMQEQAQQQQQQQGRQREEEAICRILAQHREELRRQEHQPGDVNDREQQQQQQHQTLTSLTSLTFLPGKLWTWHTPVDSGEYLTLTPRRQW